MGGECSSSAQCSGISACMNYLHENKFECYLLYENTIGSRCLEDDEDYARELSDVEVIVTCDRLSNDLRWVANQQLGEACQNNYWCDGYNKGTNVHCKNNVCVNQ